MKKIEEQLCLLAMFWCISSSNKKILHSRNLNANQQGKTIHLQYQIAKVKRIFHRQLWKLYDEHYVQVNCHFSQLDKHFVHNEKIMQLMCNHIEADKHVKRQTWFNAKEPDVAIDTLLPKKNAYLHKFILTVHRYFKRVRT